MTDNFNLTTNQLFYFMLTGSTAFLNLVDTKITLPYWVKNKEENKHKSMA